MSGQFAWSEIAAARGKALRDSLGPSPKIVPYSFQNPVARLVTQWQCPMVIESPPRAGETHGASPHSEIVGSNGDLSAEGATVWLGSGGNEHDNGHWPFAEKPC
jgi:hypothetical protein